MRCDLHVHTHCSDGAHPPAAVLELARAGGIELLSITDHDTVAAYDGLAEPTGLLLLRGVELSTHHPAEGELHILGYFPHGFGPPLIPALDELQAGRLRRMREGVARLADEAGLVLDFEQVLRRCAGPVVSRSHLAGAMVDTGLVPTYADAFSRFIGSQHPYIPPPEIAPEQAIDLIRRARGISIWAHPRLDQLQRRLDGLVAAGLNGIEVYGRTRSADDVGRLEAACASRRLLAGGGSDWHGHGPGDRLGAFSVPAESLGGLLGFCTPERTTRCAR